MYIIRHEQAEETSFIQRLNGIAIEEPREADIVFTLRSDCYVFISLMAVVEVQILGQIIVTPIMIVCY